MALPNMAGFGEMMDFLGSIASGKCIDIVLLDDLESLQVTRVLIEGDAVVENGRASFDLPPFRFLERVTHSVHLDRKLTPA